MVSSEAGAQSRWPRSSGQDLGPLSLLTGWVFANQISF